MCKAGEIGPLTPKSTFGAASVRDAFRWVQDGNHIGKAVVTISEDDVSVLGSDSSKEKALPLRLDSRATYLLTGGLGGLGTVIATWMVEHGARSLVFLSRSAGQKPQDGQLVRELQTMGCSVTCVPGRAESAEDVQKAISLAPLPIRGVIHLAMVLKDSPMATMEYDDWLAANEPKIKGALNLHEGLGDSALDFFVIASSLVTVIEQPGQGNYSAANTFLEAFTQHRRSLGLPASVLNICPIEDVGFVAENPFAHKNMKAQGLYFLGETELFDFLELAIKTSPASTTTTSHASSAGPGRLLYQNPWATTSQLIMGLRSEGDLKDPNTRTNWRRDRRMGFYHNLSTDSTAGQNSSSASEPLTKFLAEAASNPGMLAEAGSADFLAREICAKVYSLMLKDEEGVDTSLTLQQIGLDSLMAIELRRWWKQAFGLEISVLEILAIGTLGSLGEAAAAGLQARLDKGVTA